MDGMVLFTKRTNNPKLGNMIKMLAIYGIEVKVDGRSFHAPCTWVRPEDEATAWEIMGCKYYWHDDAGVRHLSTFDDIPDDVTNYHETRTTTAKLRAIDRARVERVRAAEHEHARFEFKRFKGAHRFE